MSATRPLFPVPRVATAQTLNGGKGDDLHRLFDPVESRVQLPSPVGPTREPRWTGRALPPVRQELSVVQERPLDQVVVRTGEDRLKGRPASVHAVEFPSGRHGSSGLTLPGTPVSTGVDIRNFTLFNFSYSRRRSETHSHFAPTHSDDRWTTCRHIWDTPLGLDPLGPRVHRFALRS